MTDQCKHCMLRGNIDMCLNSDCFHHENWYAKKQAQRIEELKTLINQLQEEVKKERDENATLKTGLLSVRQLMNDSYGVDGLHENGDVAAWNELEQGGRFEEWLYAFNRAENL